MEFVYEILINLSRDKYFGTPEELLSHPYVFTYRGLIKRPDEPSYLKAAWEIVSLHNRDDRPDGRLGPSFSHGDAIRIIGQSRSHDLNAEWCYVSTGIDLFTCQYSDLNVERVKLWRDMV